MKMILLIILFTSVSCSSVTEKESSKLLESEASTQSPIDQQGNNQDLANTESPYQVSTYSGNTDQIKYHKTQLKELASHGVFSKIHKQLLPTLNSDHRTHINSLDFRLLFFSEGGLYSNTSKDVVFVVYDSAMTRVRVLLFNSIENQYAELYHDIKVMNKLSEVPCGRYIHKSLDYNLGEEIIYGAGFLKQQPESYYSDGPKVKIANLSKDSDLLPELGCITNEEHKVATFNSLCFSTDTAYNNWTCMRYDAKTGIMITYFKQVFAD